MRTLRSAFLTEIANDPSVRPFLGGRGELDLGFIIKNPNNFTFECETGGFIGMKLQEGIYEIHTIFRLGAGAEALMFAENCMRWMFVHTECTELKTKVPNSNSAARWLTIKMGMRKIFSRTTAWENSDGSKDDVNYFSITIDEWASRDNAALLEGRAFHLMTKNDLSHSEDDAHDSYVGASILMAKANNTAKGAAFYNRWAIFAGYLPISIISLTPPVFDMRDAVIQINGPNLEVLLCQ